MSAWTTNTLTTVDIPWVDWCKRWVRRASTRPRVMGRDPMEWGCWLSDMTRVDLTCLKPVQMATTTSTLLTPSGPGVRVPGPIWRTTLISSTTLMSPLYSYIHSRLSNQLFRKKKSNYSLFHFYFSFNVKSIELAYVGKDNKFTQVSQEELTELLLKL